MKRLYKNSREKMICGVCQGLAEYFEIDVTLVRVAWVFLACMGGVGILAYLACVFIMPDKFEN